MLDYQINEAISASYRKMCGRVDETVGAEGVETDEPGRKNGREKAADIRRTENMLSMKHPSLRASTEEEVNRRERAEMTAADARARLRGGNSPADDPGMRIGSGVYQGLALAAPGMSVGKIKKASDAAKAVKGSAVGRQIKKGLTAYGSHSFGHEIGDQLDEFGVPKKWGNTARALGDFAAIKTLLGRSPATAEAGNLNKMLLWGVPGGFGVMQAASDGSKALEKGGYIDSTTANKIRKAGSMAGFGVLGDILWDAAGKYVINPAVGKIAERYAKNKAWKEIEKTGVSRDVFEEWWKTATKLAQEDDGGRGDGGGTTAAATDVEERKRQIVDKIRSLENQMAQLDSDDGATTAPQKEKAGEVEFDLTDAWGDD